MRDKDEKATNLDYLIQLSHGNKKFVKEMINLFLSENPEEIKFLERAIDERNYKSIKIIAHKLKSTVPFVGLDKIIGKEVSEIETFAAKSMEIADIKKHFLTIKFWCKKACHELKPV